MIRIIEFLAQGEQGEHPSCLAFFDPIRVMSRQVRSGVLAAVVKLRDP
jgi:hypothetical protein